MILDQVILLIYKKEMNLMMMMKYLKNLKLKTNYPYSNKLMSKIRISFKMILRVVIINNAINFETMLNFVRCFSRTLGSAKVETISWSTENIL